MVSPISPEESPGILSEELPLHLMGDLSLPADVKLWTTIVFVGHPMMINIDDEALHDSPCNRNHLY
jgi:hypothetical protein